jgi:hypothetical protein
MLREDYILRKEDRRADIYQAMCEVMNEVCSLPDSKAYEKEKAYLWKEYQSLFDAYSFNRFGERHSPTVDKSEMAETILSRPPAATEPITTLTEKPLQPVKELVPSLSGEQLWDFLFVEAHKAGKKAAEETVPTPVTWIAAGLDDQPLPGAEPSTVSEGMCGFAWVKFPADRRKKWGKYLNNREDISLDGYNKLIMWVRIEGQSIERKEAYAEAFAEVMNENGIKCYAMSRLD